MATTPYPFVASTVLTALQLNSTFNIPTTTKTASHTFIAADAGTRVIMNAAGSTSFTTNTSIFAASDVIELQNIGAGVCTVTAGTATVVSAGPLAIPQNGGGRLVFSSASAATYFPTAVTVAAGGLSLISTTTFAAAQTATISNCFTATHRNYLLMIEGVNSTDSGIQGQLRVGGVTTTTNYMRQRLQASSTTVNAETASSLSSFLLGGVFTSRPNSYVINIFSPAEAVATSYQAQAFYNDSTPFLMLQFGKQTSATAFDSFVVSASSGNFTGTVSIYGYAI